METLGHTSFLFSIIDCLGSRWHCAKLEFLYTSVFRRDFQGLLSYLLSPIGSGFLEEHFLTWSSSLDVLSQVFASESVLRLLDYLKFDLVAFLESFLLLVMDISI